MPATIFAANVTVDVSSPLSTVGPAAYGMGTAVYDNMNLDPALPGLIGASGVNTLRYSGGGYADIYHWSVNKVTPWFGGSSYGYVAGGTDFGHFVQLLDSAQCQPVITVNFGSSEKWNAGHTQLVSSNGGQPQEAAAWVAYANGDASLYGTPNDITIGVDADGNDWKTVGFWAKLRSSTVAQYNTWAGTANHLTDFNFLAINHPAPVGIKYWEIGNETFGSAYYNQTNTTVHGDTGYSEDLFCAYTTNRVGATNLSPAFYGKKVNAYAAAMKAVDPTIKIGAVVSTPPNDYSWDYYQRYNFNDPYNQINSSTSSAVQHWNPEVLAQCASNIDFVIAHWYPWAGNNDGGSYLLTQVASTLPSMINGAAGHNRANAGLRDWLNTYRPTDGTNVEIFITEFGYTGSIASSVVGGVNTLFAADSYCTWMELGVANIDWLELNKTTFLGDSYGNLKPGAAYYAIQLAHDVAGVGDTLLGTTSDTSTLRVHAARRQDGQLGLMLINEDSSNAENVTVTVANASLASTGTQIQFGAGNFASGQMVPSTAPSTNTVSGLGNSFTVNVPAYTITVLTIPMVNNTAPVLNPISDVTTNVGGTVTNTIVATDTGLPAQTLTFSLTSGPADAALDKINGTNAAFHWRPSVTAAGTTNVFTVTVADDGSPSLTATQSFTVRVSPLLLPSVSSAAWNNGDFTLQVGDVVGGPDYAVQVSTNLVGWSTLWITNSPAVPFQWTDTNTGASPMRFYRIKIGPPLP